MTIRIRRISALAVLALSALGAAREAVARDGDAGADVAAVLGACARMQPDLFRQMQGAR